MATPELSPMQKYEQFCNTHPQYKKMSREQICSIMVKEKILTQAELQELNKPLFGWNKTNKNKYINNDNVYEGLGVHLSEKQQVKPRNYVEQPKFYHPVIKALEVDKSGKVDLNTYTLKGLRQLYDEKNYKIAKKENGKIIVSGKDGKPVLDVFEDKTFKETSINFIDKNGNSQRVVIKPNGEIQRYDITKNVNGTGINTYYKEGEKFPYQKFELYPNGDHKQTNYDGKTGKKKYEDYWKKDGCSAEWIVEYSDGKPYKKAKGPTDETPEYILVNDLKDDIYAKTSLGLPTTRKSISSNVLKRINYDNVLETMEKYKELTGNELIDDIDNEIGLSKNERNKLINHIETLYCKAAPAKESGEYLAQKLFDDISGPGSGELAQHVKMIDSNNLKYVLTEYRKLSVVDNRNTERNISDIQYRLQEIFIDTGSLSADDIAEKLAPIEGLLTAISDEWGLKQSKRTELINKIIDVTLKDKPSEVQSRIKRNISAHPNDYHKVEIDLYRAENTKGGDLRNPELKNEKLETSKNKTLKGQIKQGLTGDCWLLAGLNSIIAKPNMLKELENLVTIDKKTGDYHVKLNADNRNLTYIVSKRDLEEYTAISTGSEKVNAIEIAMDKYIRDLAYNDRKDILTVDDEFGYINSVTIDSNHSSFLWRTLFGNNYALSDTIDSSTEDFNNQNRVYAMSLKGAEIRCMSGLAKSEKEKNYNIISRHAYSIVGSDDENIYLLNPWDSDDKITITRENFKKLDAYIYFYEIPKKK